MKLLIFILLISVSLPVLAECGSLLYNQNLFRPAKDQGLLFSSIKKVDINGNEIQSGDNIKRIVLFENGTAVEGKLSHVFVDTRNTPAYIGFNSESQLLSTDGSGNFFIIKNQGFSQHADGFGMPIGSPELAAGDVSSFTEMDWHKINVIPGKKVSLNYSSGVKVNGEVSELQKDASGFVRVIKFSPGSAKVTFGNQVLFDPSWGTYDLLIGTKPINDMPF